MTVRVKNGLCALSLFLLIINNNQYCPKRFKSIKKRLDSRFQNIVPALPSGGSGDVRRSVCMRASFGVHAYSVRCTCVRRSAYVTVWVESDDEMDMKGVAQRRFPTGKQT